MPSLRRSFALTPWQSALRCLRCDHREDFLYVVKGGSLRSPPAPPAAGGRKRPSSRGARDHQGPDLDAFSASAGVGQLVLT